MKELDNICNIDDICKDDSVFSFLKKRALGILNIYKLECIYFSHKRINYLNNLIDNIQVKERQYQEYINKIIQEAKRNIHDNKEKRSRKKLFNKFLLPASANTGIPPPQRKKKKKKKKRE